MPKFITEVKRTHRCGALTRDDVGREVVLFGWVQSRRDHGGAVFIDLRDREGIAQVVFEAELLPEVHRLAHELRHEDVIGVRGVVASRGANANPRLKTGAVEVRARELEIFNRSETPPFLIEAESDPAPSPAQASEEKRLALRFLDLRRPPLQHALRTRHRMNQITRNYLSGNDFLELETPVLVRYTPGGARNFLVPSRLNPGRFYALAESPQIFKQLFMVAGFDRYFQIVRCFRDEDLRLDRQPEFTQIDLEMSFVSQDDVFEVVEGLICALWKELLGVEVPRPFARMPYAESMRLYGNDKPDLRFALPHTDVTELVRAHRGGGVPMLAEAVEQGICKLLRVPKEASISRSEADKLEELARGMGAQGLARARIAAGGEWTQSPFKSIEPALRDAINEAAGAREGDLLLFQMGRAATAHTVLANLRLHLARRMKLIPEVGSGGRWHFLWVVDPPLFERDEASGRWVAAHHAFTRPHDQHLPYLASDPGRVLCHRYDLVLNGFEVGGGSIRLHDPEVQQQVFAALGIGADEAEAKFGFLLKALRYGAPPHGGIALGMDRLAMLLSGAESLREVIAFPKTQRGTDLLTGAPGEVDPAQLAELHVKSTA